MNPLARSLLRRTATHYNLPHSHHPTTRRPQKSYVNRKKSDRLFFIWGETRKLQASKKYVSIFDDEKSPPKRKQATIRVLSSKKGGGKIRKKLLEPPLFLFVSVACHPRPYIRHPAAWGRMYGVNYINARWIWKIKVVISWVVRPRLGLIVAATRHILMNKI